MGEIANLENDMAFKITDHTKIENEIKKNNYDNIFFKNLEGLKERANVVLFNNPKWEMNPKQFCIDNYNGVHFYQVILLINNIPSVFTFKSENFKDFKIYAPPKREILRVLSYSRG